MRIYDTHVHVDHFGAAEARMEAVTEGVAAGVLGMLVPAVSPADWSRVTGSVSELRRAVPELWMEVALGVHPHCVRELDDRALEAAVAALPSLLRDSGAAAVGEIGLDYRWDSDPLARARQVRAFAMQLEIARDLALPVVLHALGAQQDLLELLRDVALAPPGGVMHSFSGSAELVRQLVPLGLHFSFGAAVARPGAQKAPVACKAVPDERLLVETDAPYQSPRPGRGADCRPSDILAVVEAVARIRGQAVETVAELTWTNARALLFTRSSGP
jgi:TatD DNase family protein